MKIACLQLAADLGSFDVNVQKAERCLADVQPGQLDLLVLPELAFSGYNFDSLAAIQPFLEPTSKGPSSQWAIRTARRLGCVVHIGYPEISSEPLEKSEPAVDAADGVAHKRYNATVTVAPDGEIIAHYRKSFLYYTDDSWASEGSGFVSKAISLCGANDSAREARLLSTNVALGICMDINPYKFTAPWDAFEFANHAKDTGAGVVLLSMAWSSHDLDEERVSGNEANLPHLPTLSYWVQRFQPLFSRHDTKVIVICANRAGKEGDVCYAGTSTVMRLGNYRGDLWGMLGTGEEALLVVDTDQVPKSVIRLREPDDDKDKDVAGPLA